ncbi:MAG: hypothetical protein MI748_12835, partial [Opitutales bacterium]|nr:hypothetical protein [Opitutales bacterium]
MVSIANANQLLRTYTWGKDLYGPGGIGGLLSMEIKSGTQQGKYLYSYDAKGNVTQVIKAETGEVVNKYEYDPYGNMTSKVELSGYE